MLHRCGTHRCYAWRVMPTGFVPTIALCLAVLLGDVWPAEAQTRPDGLYGTITTPKGAFTIRFEFEKVPMTVASFVGLAEGMIENDAFAMGVPFFDGSAFQRVVPGHVIQGGGANSDRSNTSGTPLPNEVHLDLRHDSAGVVAMANGGPHTAQTQFYVTLGDRSYLDPDYVVFGEVVEGMDVVYAIEAGDAIETVRIARVGIAAEAFRPTTEVFRRLAGAVWERVLDEEAARAVAEDAYVAQQWPNAIDSGTGWSSLIVREGSGRIPRLGDRIEIRYSARTFRGEEFGSVAPFGGPGWLEEDAMFGATFTFEVGEMSVTPAFDEAVAQMQPGERRVVIAPAEMAYGPGGHYSPVREGQPRFRISPNMMVIYEIDVFPATIPPRPQE